MAGTSVDYARAAFELIDDFDRTKTPEEVVERLASALSVFGYSAILITGVPEPPQRVEPYFLMNGWPRGWSKHHANENYYADNPTAAWCRRTINPFEWSEAVYEPEGLPRAAEDLGMKKGFLAKRGIELDRSSPFANDTHGRKKDQQATAEHVGQSRWQHFTNLSPDSQSDQGYQSRDGSNQKVLPPTDP